MNKMFGEKYYDASDDEAKGIEKTKDIDFKLMKDADLDEECDEVD